MMRGTKDYIQIICTEICKYVTFVQRCSTVVLKSVTVLNVDFQDFVFKLWTLFCKLCLVHAVFLSWIHQSL